METRLDLERTTAHLEILLRICARKGNILVLMQNNPDPDAIASAAAIRELVRARLRKRVVIGYGGVFGRAENRAMVHELGIETQQVQTEDLARYRTVCLVDTQPRSGNNALFTSRPAEIVIDHHEGSSRRTWAAELADVRPDYGATSTILYEYVVASGIDLNPNLATALYYGIYSDTSALGRKVSAADLQAFQALAPLADMRRLARIRRAPVPPAYFEMLRDSLTNAVLAGNVVVTFIRGCGNPDMFAEIAEMMVRLEGIRVSICYGACGQTVHLSARAVDDRGNLAERMRRVMAGIGTGGGHRSMAGGQAPFGVGEREKRLEQVRVRILRHFAGNREQKRLLG